MNNTGKSKRLDALLEFYANDPKDSFVKYGIALEYIKNKEYLKAEEYFKLILTDDPNYIPAYLQYGQMKVGQNNPAEAKVLYRQGIEIAKKAGDKHAASEMEEFLNELE